MLNVSLHDQNKLVSDQVNTNSIKFLKQIKTFYKRFYIKLSFHARNKID